MKPEQDSYTCSGFRNRKTACASSHFIRRVVLEQIVLELLQKITAFVKANENAFVEKLQSGENEKEEKEIIAEQKSLVQAEKRVQELDKIIQGLFEKNALGVISDERFVKLSRGYVSEQKDLSLKVKTLKTQIEKHQEFCLNVGQFLRKVRKYTEPTELSTVMLNELVERIVVHARDKKHGRSVQQIDIYFNYVGKIDLSLPTELS